MAMRKIKFINKENEQLNPIVDLTDNETITNINGNITTINTTINNYKVDLDDVKNALNEVKDKVDGWKEVDPSTIKTSELDNDANFMTSSQVYSAINDFKANSITNNYYTKAQLDKLLADFKKSHYEKVTELPETPEEQTIYLLLKSDNTYSQYIYEDGEWIDLGSTELNLENYYTKDEINSMDYMKVKSTTDSLVINRMYEALSDVDYILRDEEGHLRIGKNLIYDLDYWLTKKRKLNPDADGNLNNYYLSDETYNGQYDPWYKFQIISNVCKGIKYDISKNGQKYRKLDLIHYFESENHILGGNYITSCLDIRNRRILRLNWKITSYKLLSSYPYDIQLYEVIEEIPLGNSEISFAFIAPSITIDSEDSFDNAFDSISGYFEVDINDGFTFDYSERHDKFWYTYTHIDIYLGSRTIQNYYGRFERCSDKILNNNYQVVSDLYKCVIEKNNIRTTYYFTFGSGYDIIGIIPILFTLKKITEYISEPLTTELQSNYNIKYYNFINLFNNYKFSKNSLELERLYNDNNNLQINNILKDTYNTTDLDDFIYNNNYISNILNEEKTDIYYFCSDNVNNKFILEGETIYSDTSFKITLNNYLLLSYANKTGNLDKLISVIKGESTELPDCASVITSIDWGDGNTETFTPQQITSIEEITKEITHNYDKYGTYKITISYNSSSNYLYSYNVNFNITSKNFEYINANDINIAQIYGSLVKKLTFLNKKNITEIINELNNFTNTNTKQELTNIVTPITRTDYNNLLDKYNDLIKIVDKTTNNYNITFNCLNWYNLSKTVESFYDIKMKDYTKISDIITLPEGTEIYNETRTLDNIISSNEKNVTFKIISTDEDKDKIKIQIPNIPDSFLNTDKFFVAINTNIFVIERTEILAEYNYRYYRPSLSIDWGDGTTTNISSTEYRDSNDSEIYGDTPVNETLKTKMKGYAYHRYSNNKDIIITIKFEDGVIRGFSNISYVTSTNVDWLTIGTQTDIKLNKDYFLVCSKDTKLSEIPSTTILSNDVVLNEIAYTTYLDNLTE